MGLRLRVSTSAGRGTVEGQPRVVVMHEKHGREHIHVVWARTDIDTMTLRSDSMNYLAHERASKALELEFGHELVPGKHDKRDREQQPEFPRAEYDHAEWQQGERAGVSPAERKDQITALKQLSDGAQAFKAALEDQGYILAKGDKCDFVILDQAGDVHNLARQIHGMKAADLRQFMKGLDREALPTAEQAAEIQQQKQDERKQAAAEQSETSPEQQRPIEEKTALSPDEIQAIEKAVAERQAREVADIRQRHDAEFGRTSKVLDDDMTERFGDLAARQEAERARFERENQPATGLNRVIDALQRWWNPKLAQERDAERTRRQLEMEERQRTARDDYEKTLKQTRDLELENLGERHAHSCTRPVDVDLGAGWLSHVHSLRGHYPDQVHGRRGTRR